MSGTKITMEAPKLTGFTRDNRAYKVTADAAAQDITNPTVLELTGIRGKMEMQSNGNSRHDGRRRRLQHQDRSS